MFHDIADNRRRRHIAGEIPGIPGPLEGKMHLPAGYLNILEGLQYGTQHGHLSLRITGLTEGAPERVFDGGQARDTKRSGYIRHGGEDDGCKAGGFQFTLYQSNGPAANWSGRDEDDDIHMVCAQIANDGRYGFLKQFFGLQDITHHRIIPGCGLADLASPFQLLQLF